MSNYGTIIGYSFIFKECTMTYNEPNIFNYATSELSQDAFFCWILAWADEKYKKSHNELYKFSHILIKEMTGMTNLIFKSVENQVNRIDILVKLQDSNNNNYVIIIEDKTFTYEHDGQIQKYCDNLTNDNKNNYKEVFLVYLKTGYTSKIEKEYLEQKYSKLKIFDNEIIAKLLKKAPQHYLINAWQEIFAKLSESIKEAEKCLTKKTSNYNFIKHCQSQAEKIKREIFLEDLTNFIKTLEINAENPEQIRYFIHGADKRPTIELFLAEKAIGEESQKVYILYKLYLNIASQKTSLILAQQLFVDKKRVTLKEGYGKYQDVCEKDKEIIRKKLEGLVTANGWIHVDQKSNLTILEKELNYDVLDNRLKVTSAIKEAIIDTEILRIIQESIKS